MKSLPTLLLAIAAAATAPAYAQADLAQKKNCMACHAIDKKLVGPAYKDVAAIGPRPSRFMTIMATPMMTKITSRTP